MRQHGWATRYWPARANFEGRAEIAVSWRRAKFELLGTEAHKMHPGAGLDETAHPFKGRHVTVVRLRHRASGLTVTLLNTHVNQHIETGQEWQTNINVPYAKRHLAWLADRYRSEAAAVVVGTGDYNWDHYDDRRAQPEGGITDAFRGRAVSSYQALGLQGVQPTKNARWIDYVFLASKTLQARRAQFATHESLGGYRSDHRPLLARIRLYR